LTRHGAGNERAGVGSAFFVSTAVEPKGSGRYDASVDETFNLVPLPQGGIVTALALRAMGEELGDPSERLRTLHTTFVAQVAHGPVHIEVDVLRRGRSMSHLKAEVRNEGANRGHITTAVFGRTREGFEFTDLAPPSEIPRPADGFVHAQASPTAATRVTVGVPSTTKRR